MKDTYVRAGGGCLGVRCRRRTWPCSDMLRLGAGNRSRRSPNGATPCSNA